MGAMQGRAKYLHTYLKVGMLKVHCRTDMFLSDMLCIAEI